MALKTMVDQTKTEYDCVKMLREIQIMRKLNELSQALHKKTAKSGKVGTLKGNVTPKSIFLPELIDIICPTLSKRDQPTGAIASTGGSGPPPNSSSSLQENSHSSSEMAKLKDNMYGVN